MDIAQRLGEALAGRYEVDALVGEGGMALVYGARDLKHHRRVAIKVLRPDLSASLGAERFLREIEIAAGLNHPNILPVHDSGEADGLLYFVMPFVEGESLRERLNREGRLSLEDVLRIASEIGDALDYAHGRGLVHRDIKPENILFQARHALISDFGVAKATTEGGEGLTRTGVAVGTFTYMSPEQLAGDDAVDQRSDVYALGCLVMEMLSGEVPFAAPNPQVSLKEKLTGQVPDLKALQCEAPDTVQRTLEVALASDANRRYETAGAFVKELETASTTAAVEAEARRRRRRGGLRAAIGLVGIGVLAGAAWWVSSMVGGPAMTRIAVLPLESAPPDSSREYLVAGMHQDLILELAKAGMRVINANSVARYREAAKPIGEIADELDVDGVIQGSASYAGDSVGVQLVLIDPKTEELVWVESFAADMRNVMGLYGRMTLTIADRTGNEVPPEVRARLTEAPPVDPQVYDALLQARFHWQKLTPEGFETALDYFHLALSRDSTSLNAWRGIALAWQVKSQEGLVSPEEASLHADSALARAEALDPDFEGGLVPLALRKTWFEWSWEEALDAFQGALEQDPTDSSTRAYYAVLLLYLGRENEALEQMERAAGMDPFNTLVQGIYAQILNALHRYEEAEERLLRVGERDPEAPMVYTTLRTTYHLMGRHEEAVEMWRRSFRAQDDTGALEALERGYSEGGYPAALRSVAELMIARSDTMYIRPIVIGTLYTRAGMKEEALHFLELAFEEGSPGIPYLSVDPIFDFMRDDPRFQAMVDGLGLPR